jgi:hypothetical protein
MHDRERSLVKHYQGKSFAVLGVKIDADMEALRNAEKEHAMPWRTIWDGGSKKNARAYRVQGTPALFLIDKNGRLALSFAGLTDEKVLEKQIDQLLAEPEESAADTK